MCKCNGTRERGKPFCNLIHATDRYNNENLVAYADLTVLSDISHKGGDFAFFLESVGKRLVDIFYFSRKIGLCVVSMYVLPFFYVRCRVTYGVSKNCRMYNRFYKLLK